MADDRDKVPPQGAGAVTLLGAVFEAPQLDDEQLDYLCKLQRQADQIDDELVIGGPQRRALSR